MNFERSKIVVAHITLLGNATTKIQLPRKISDSQLPSSLEESGLSIVRRVPSYRSALFTMTGEKSEEPDGRDGRENVNDRHQYFSFIPLTSSPSLCLADLCYWSLIADMAANPILGSFVNIRSTTILIFLHDMSRVPPILGSQIT